MVLHSGLLFGCAVGPSPYLPDTWVQPIGHLHTVGTTSDLPRLQVFIAYSGIGSSHSALRMVTDRGHVIFWDPAGDYGRFDDDWYAQFGPLAQNFQRENDLILGNPPDVETFIRWRWTLEDTSVEMFEWDLSAQWSRKLEKILLHGTTNDHPTGSFSTWTVPMFCTMATSDFLRRFTSPMIQLTERYFFPHNLAQALYAQSPSRVHVFTEDGEKSVYIPPGPTSVQK
ncbi:MAG: hypothetical protein ACPGYT_00815 [Nitrospirales bacterium]